MPGFLKLLIRVRRLSATVFALPLLLCTTGCGGFWNGGNGDSSPHVLSITITPNPYQVALGSTGQVKATGKFSDGKERDLTDTVSWTVEGGSIASISNTGAIQPLATGEGSVRAEYGSMVITVPLTVTPAPLVSLEVTPVSPAVPLGLSVQLKAVGHYADSSTTDLTSKASWSSSSKTVATAGSDGQAVSHSVGATTVSASMGNVQGSAALSVTAAALTGIVVTGDNTSIPLGEKTQMHAVGGFTDGSQHDLTASVQWTSSDPKVVTVDNAGLAIAGSPGSATISAAVNSVSGSSPLAVTSAALTAIAVTGDNASIALGQKTQMHAEGNFTDGSQHDLTASAQWTSSDPKVVTVDNSGLAIAGSPGSAMISAAVKSVLGSGPLSVTSAELTAIAVTGDSTSVPLGRRTQMHAVGTFTDGSQQDLTSSAEWTSSDPKIVAVDNSGLAVGSSLGTATISAGVKSVSGSSALSVTSAALASLSVSPSSSVILFGRTQQLLLIATYTDGSTADVTANATWDSSNPQAASVDAHGVVLALDVGNSQLTASYQNQQASASVTVQPGLAVSRFILPPAGLDTMLRILSPGSTPSNSCAMIYVFDQNQQMSECCGCNISRDGLLALSYADDLLANPLTGIQSSAGTVMVIAADKAVNPSCDAGSITPSGHLETWSTTLEDLGRQSYAVTETPGLDAPLTDTQSANVQAQCAFLKILGSGHGICSCGKSPTSGY